MTAYRDRMLAGEYQPKADTRRLDGKQLAKTVTKRQQAKKGKRSGK